MPASTESGDPDQTSPLVQVLPHGYEVNQYNVVAVVLFRIQNSKS